MRNYLFRCNKTFTGKNSSKAQHDTNDKMDEFCRVGNGAVNKSYCKMHSSI